MENNSNALKPDMKAVQKIIEALASPEGVNLKDLAEALHETADMTMDAYLKGQEAGRAAAQLRGEASYLRSGEELVDSKIPGVRSVKNKNYVVDIHIEVPEDYGSTSKGEVRGPILREDAYLRVHSRAGRDDDRETRTELDTLSKMRQRGDSRRTRSECSSSHEQYISPSPLDARPEDSNYLVHIRRPSSQGFRVDELDERILRLASCVRDLLRTYVQGIS